MDDIYPLFLTFAFRLESFISHSYLAWIMGFGISQERDSDSASGSKTAPMKSGQSPDIRPRSRDFVSACVSLSTIRGR